MADNGFTWATQPYGLNRPRPRSNNRMPTSYNSMNSNADPKAAEALNRKLQPPSNINGQIGSLENLANMIPGDHLATVSSRINGQITDAKNILRQLPDVALAGRILTAAICNSGGQKTVTLIDSSHKNILGALADNLVGVINEYFTKEYDLSKQVNRWVHDALMVTGVNATVILPESTIDRVINSKVAVGNEAYDREFARISTNRFQILGKGRTDIAAMAAGIEDGDKPVIGEVYNELGYRVIDNIEAIKLPALSKRYAKDRLAECYLGQFGRYAGMSVAGLNDDKKPMSHEDAFAAALRDQSNGKVTLKKNYYGRERTYSADPFIILRDPSTLENPPIGHPELVRASAEALIPITDPTDKSEHVGYLGIIDETGNFYTEASATDYNSSRYDQGINAGDVPGILIQQASMATSMNMSDANAAKPEKLDYNRALGLYEAVFWDDLTKRINNGILGRSYNVTKVERVSRIMFSIALQKKRCQLVFIPASLVNYFCFNYDDDGVGESLVEMSKTLASQRLILQFAETNAAYQQSITRRRLNIKIDPREPDIQQAVRMVYQNYMLNRQSIMPINCIDPVTINQSVWRQAIEVNVESDPRYPQTKLDVEDIQPVVTEPNTEYMDKLRGQHMMGFMLTPEQVDQQLGNERAISDLLNNDMFRERIVEFQGIANFHLTDLVQKFTLNSSILMDKLRAIVVSNKEKIIEKFGNKNASLNIEEFLINFVVGVTVSLPNIDNDQGMDKIDQEFEVYKGFIDKTADLYFDANMYRVNDQYTALGGFEVAKAMYKAYEMRKWMRRRGAIPDMEQMLVKDENGRPMMNIFEEMADFVKLMIPMLTKFDMMIRGVNDQANDANPPRGGEAAQEAGAYNDGGTGQEDGGFEFPEETGGGEGDGLDDDFGQEPNPDDDTENPDDDETQKQDQNQNPEGDDEGNDDDENKK